MKHPSIARLIAVTAALSSAAFAASCGGDDSSTTDDSGTPDTSGGDSSLGDSGGDGSSGNDALADGADAYVDPTCFSPPCASQLSLGLAHGCAVMKDNSVECWGLNANGQLGSGVNDAGTFDPTSQSIPRVVQGLGPAAFVTAGWYHTCALLQDNSVWCWGDNSKAQLGMTASSTPQPVPQKITLTGTVAEVEAGGWHTCVRMQTGAVQCWGFNTDGQVGTGSGNPNSPATVPAANTVAGFGSATDLGLGSRYSCALIGGGAQCIGNNFFGELGRGTPISLPFTPASGAVGGLAGATDIARANGEHQCAVIDGGTLQCWGRNDNGQLLVDSGAATYIVAPNAIPGVSTAVEVAPGGTHTCAALANGEVWCWGADLHGQTGQAANDAGTSAATKVAGITTAIHIASGWADFSCASLKGGSVQCWGANYDSELGRGTGGVLLPFDEKPAPIKFQ